MKVKVGEICKSCKYHRTRWTGGCDYSEIMKRSRLFTDGKRIEKGYCDKYEEGKRKEYDPKIWRNRGVKGD